MSSPGYEHLGLLQDTRAEVDAMHEASERHAERDDLVSIKPNATRISSTRD